MTENSKIAWTDHTFNPWIGCSKVSAGCDNCYAFEQAKRWGWDNFGAGKARRRTKEANWNKVRKWNRDSEAKSEKSCYNEGFSSIIPRVFCASLADFCDPDVTQEWKDDLWDLIWDTKFLNWLMLTKRPMLLKQNLPYLWFVAPWYNVWGGTTVENQNNTYRIDQLCEVNFRTKFLSCEPLLGPIDFGNNLELIDWVIVGGESGPKARPMDEDWVRDIRDQCSTHGVRFFYKQRGGGGPNSHNLPTLDGKTWTEVPND